MLLMILTVGISKSMNVARIGVVGYCPPTKYDGKRALAFLEEAFDQCERDFSGRKLVIVSGVTNNGVLAQAYALATERGYETGGVACVRAIQFELFPLTEEPILIGHEWGDESLVFVHGISAIKDVDPDKIAKYCFHPHYGLDAMIRVGLGPQSVRETNMIKVLGKPTYELDLEKMN